MTYEVRHTAEHEWRAAADTMRAALLFPPSTDADWERPNIADSWRDGMSLSAWDGAHCIGHAGALDFEMMVPGGARVPMAGVTRVGVRSTHRRQGVLTAMMERLLRESAERGQVLATLRASEGVIYQRFGFQVGGEVNDIEIDRRGGRGRLAAPVAAGTMRVLSREETFDTVAALHPRVGFDRPGTVNRKEWALRRYLIDALAPDKGTYVAVHSGPDGTDDGYVVHSLDWPHTFASHPGGTCVVTDLWAATPAIELALWKYVLEIDLLDTVRAEERPVDDPLRFALADQRNYLVKARADEQWVRLLDVDAGLRARSYNAAQGAVTIAVADPLFPANDGTWRVTAEGAIRVAAPAGATADLATAINGISAAYLGGVTWGELQAAGVVHEHMKGAVATADVLFAARPMPRCGSFF